MAQSSTQVPLRLARCCDRTNAVGFFFPCTLPKSEEKKTSRRVPSTAIPQSLQTDNKRCVFFTFLIKARKCLPQIEHRHFLSLTSAKYLSALEVQSDVRKYLKTFLLLLLELLHLLRMKCKIQKKTVQSKKKIFMAAGKNTVRYNT